MQVLGVSDVIARRDRILAGREGQVAKIACTVRYFLSLGERKRYLHPLGSVKAGKLLKLLALKDIFHHSGA